MSPHSAYTPCHRDKVWPPLTCSCGYLCAGMSEEEEELELADNVAFHSRNMALETNPVSADHTQEK